MIQNILLAYMRPNNVEANTHFAETVRKGVPICRIERLLPADLREKLATRFVTSPIPIWGSRNSIANRRNFERAQSGDYFLIVEGKYIKLIAKIAEKVSSHELSRELWPSTTTDLSGYWALVYFLWEPQEVNIPFRKFAQLFGYKESYALQGLTTVSQVKLDNFRRRYDDLLPALFGRLI